MGEETFRVAHDLVDDYVVVDTDAVCAAIKDIFADTRSIVEPSGAPGRGGNQAIRGRSKDQGQPTPPSSRART